MEEKNVQLEMYDGKVWGHKVSQYGLEYKKLDYRTLAEMVGDMVMCNNIRELFYNSEIGEFYLENGNDYNEEEDYYEDIYQYFIISGHGAEILEKYTDEIVYYNETLDMYVWGITHFGTSWDYVLTDIDIVEMTISE